MISVPPPLLAGQDKTMLHSATEYHPSRKSSIRDTKDEMLLQLRFYKKGLPLFLLLCPFFLTVWFLRVTNMEHFVVD